MIVYPASKARYHFWFSALQAAGVPLQASWLSWKYNVDSTIEPSADDWAHHVETCLKEAANCDVLLLVVQEEDRSFGSLLLAGSALGAGKRVFLVAPHGWPFLRNHPRVRSFDTLADAVSAIMAAVNGEKMRLAA